MYKRITWNSVDVMSTSLVFCGLFIFAPIAAILIIPSSGSTQFNTHQALQPCSHTPKLQATEIRNTLKTHSHSDSPSQQAQLTNLKNTFIQKYSN